MYDHQKWGATYLEEHEIAWLLGNTILECGTLANAALCCEACPATELVGVHVELRWREEHERGVKNADDGGI